MFRKNWHYEEPPENMSVLAYVYSEKTKKKCYSIAKKVCGFWFLQRYIDQINIPVLSDYKIICWQDLPKLPTL